MFFKKLIQEMDIRAVKGSKPEASHLKQHEIWNIINSIDTSELLELRNKVILSLGYYAGLRRSEIANLEWRDVKSDKLVIRGAKGGT